MNSNGIVVIGTISKVNAAKTGNTDYILVTTGFGLWIEAPMPKGSAAAMTVGQSVKVIADGMHRQISFKAGIVKALNSIVAAVKAVAGGATEADANDALAANVNVTLMLVGDISMYDDSGTLIAEKSRNVTENSKVNLTALSSIELTEDAPAKAQPTKDTKRQPRKQTA